MKTTLHDIEQQVIAIVAEMLGIRREDVVLDVSLVEDLGATRMMLAEIALEVARRFRLSARGAAEGWQTPRDVVRAVAKHLDIPPC